MAIDSVKVTHNLSWAEVSDILVTACEGGISYWCANRIEYKSGDCYSPENLEAYVRCTENPHYGKRWRASRKYRLTTSSLASALDTCATKYPHIMARIIDKAYDASDADVIFQLATFGEVVFG